MSDAMVELDGLAERLFDEELAGRVVFRDRIGGGRFIGYNDGDGGEIEVLSPEAMDRVRGVSDPLAAVRYVAAHEMGHDYVSDENPREHAMMDAEVIGDLMQRGDYAAAREGINLHMERAKTARGRDRQFSEYALAMLAGENTDGGSEPSCFSQRYGGGLPDGKKDMGLFTGFLDRLYKYWMETFPETYAPLNKPLEKGWGYVKNSVKGFFWEGVENLAGSGNILSNTVGSIARGFKITYKGMAEDLLAAISPLMRTCVLAYGSGKTELNQIWNYRHNDGQLYPIFWNRFDDIKDPTQEQLDAGIKHVKENDESPFNGMTRDVSRPLLNSNFVDWAADNYTGNCWSDHFQEEPTRPLRFFVKSDTKGAWSRDSQAESRLPAGYAGQVEVHKKYLEPSSVLGWIAEKIYKDKRPKSWTKIRENIAGDIGQDMAYVGLGGAFMATFLQDVLKAKKETVRYVMEEYMKIGENIQESLFGVKRNFAFERA